MIGRIKHRALKRLYERDDHSGFSAHDIRRLRQILALLDEARTPSDLDLPGLHLHMLRGSRAGTWAVTVRANFRVTWRIDADGGFIDMDYEDYH
ncbi:MAG: type II toxin-antitoxin system RelE/ParE family toxin [Gammaproteobacteria bacterium]